MRKTLIEPGRVPAPISDTKETLPSAERDDQPVEAFTPLKSEDPGRYRLVRELARGGQGVVSLAFDNWLGREIAFKQLLHPGAGVGAELTPAEARFLREARITAQLDHPGIAPLHEVGRRADGSLYAVQKLVRGRTLADALDRCTSLKDRLQLVPALLGAAQAVAFAHGRAVIHRDLKPTNIMVGDLGEVVVLDWGIGRTGATTSPSLAPVDSLVGDDASQTRDGTVIGTPAYMSPEQAVGAIQQVGARSDVWSLGIILYELLTGSRPFTGKSSEEVLQAVVTSDPKAVRERCAGAPSELAAIAERALRRDPARRYASAKEMTGDLSAWLSGGRVAAHEYTSWELVKKFVGRHRAATLAAGVGIVAVGVAALGWRARSIDLQHHLSDALLVEARAAARDLRWAEAAAYSAASLAAEDRPTGWLNLAVAEQNAPVPVSVPGAKTAGLVAAKFLPDGSPAIAVIVGDGSEVSFDDEADEVAGGAAVEVKDAVSGKLVARVPRPGVRMASFSGDGKVLLTVTRSDHGDNLVERWQLPSGARLPGKATKPIRAGMTPSPDGASIAVWRRDGRMSEKLPLGELSVRPLADGRGTIVAERVAGAFAFAPDSRSLVAIDADGRPIRIELENGKRTILKGTFFRAYSVAALSQGSALVGTQPGSIALTSPDGFMPLASLHRTRVSSLALAGDQSRMASLSWDMTVGIWNANGARVPSFTPVARVPAHGLISSIDLAADGGQLLLALPGLRSHLWTLPRPVPALWEQTRSQRVLAISADGRSFATAGRETPTRVFDSLTGREKADASGRSEFVWRQQLSFSADGRRFAALGANGVEVLDLSTPTPGSLARLDAVLPPITLSPDGERLLAPDRKRSNAPTCWNASSGERLWAIPQGESAAFEADGRWVAVGGPGTVQLIEVATGKIGRTWQLRGTLTATAISPDGRRIASAGDDGAFLIDVASGKVIELDHPEETVWSVAISPDGSKVALSGPTVSVFDARTGEPLVQIPRYEAGFFVAFTPDGALLDAGSVVRRTVVDASHGESPQRTLQQVLHRYRLRMEGQRVLQDDALQ